MRAPDCAGARENFIAKMKRESGVLRFGAGLLLARQWQIVSMKSFPYSRRVWRLLFVSVALSGPAVTAFAHSS